VALVPALLARVWRRLLGEAWMPPTGAAGGGVVGRLERLVWL